MPRRRTSADPTIPRSPATKTALPFSSKMGSSGDAIIFCRPKFGGSSSRVKSSGGLSRSSIGYYRCALSDRERGADRSYSRAVRRDFCIHNTHAPALFGMARQGYRDILVISCRGRSREFFVVGRHPRRDLEPIICRIRAPSSRGVLGSGRGRRHSGRLRHRSRRA
jgi:hypothetical protein